MVIGDEADYGFYLIVLNHNLMVNGVYLNHKKVNIIDSNVIRPVMEVVLINDVNHFNSISFSNNQGLSIVNNYIKNQVAFDVSYIINDYILVMVRIWVKGTFGDYWIEEDG